MECSWYPDNRPKPNGDYATINRKRYPTVLVDKVQRFPANRIIRDLVDAGREGRKLGLSEIAGRAGRGAYSKEEMHELYRLMGYSVCGFAEVFEDDSIGSSMWGAAGSAAGSRSSRLGGSDSRIGKSEGDE